MVISYVNQFHEIRYLSKTVSHMIYQTWVKHGLWTRIWLTSDDLNRDRRNARHLRIAYTPFLSFCDSFMSSVWEKIRFRAHIRDRTKENPFSFACTISYNSRMTNMTLCVCVTRITSVPIKNFFQHSGVSWGYA